MITFKPDSEKSKQFNDGTVVFTAYENNTASGSACFKLNGYICEIFKVNFGDKLYLFQGLVRACLNYAAERNAYMGKLTDKDCFDAAKTMNFIFYGENYMNDIPTLLMGMCHQDELVTYIENIPDVD